jgi:hypothetical protein
MWKPPSYAVPFQCRWVSSASFRVTVLGVARADAVEDEQQRRVWLVAVAAVGHPPAGAPHRPLTAVDVLHLPLAKAHVLVDLRGEDLRGLEAVVDLHEQQRHPVLGRDDDDVRLGAPSLPGLDQVPVAGSATSVA